MKSTLYSNPACLHSNDQKKIIQIQNNRIKIPQLAGGQLVSSFRITSVAKDKLKLGMTKNNRTALGFQRSDRFWYCVITVVLK